MACMIIKFRKRDNEYYIEVCNADNEICTVSVTTEYPDRIIITDVLTHILSPNDNHYDFTDRMLVAAFAYNRGMEQDLLIEFNYFHYNYICNITIMNGWVMNHGI